MFDIKIMLASFENSAIKQLVMKELLSDRKEKRNSHQANEHIEENCNNNLDSIEKDEVFLE